MNQPDIKPDVPSPYDADYFQNGVAAGKSCYTDYRWIPERSIPWAHRLCRRLDIKPGAPVLDYGCAYGYTVRALRMLDIQAYGCDISEHAIEAAPPDVREHLYLSMGPEIPLPSSYRMDVIIAKDVLEHFASSEVHDFLRSAAKFTTRLFVVVPLGNSVRYNILAYEHDVTHKIREPWGWWYEKFQQASWSPAETSFDMRGLKDNWAHFPEGNAAFTLVR